MKDMIVQDAATLQPRSIRMLLAVSAVDSIDIWTSDVRQAYLQSKESISRDLFITKPATEF